jgi:hypothetical protein
MRENALDHRRLFDRRDDLQFAATLATLNIDVVHPLEQARPTHTRMRAIGRVRRRRGNRHNRRPRFGVRHEHPMKTDEMQAWAKPIVAAALKVDRG